jgi:hypothetical protein
MVLYRGTVPSGPDPAFLVAFRFALPHEMATERAEYGSHGDG